MLCYVMLCYVMLCYVMLCYNLCYVMLCYVMLCYVMLCYVMLCYVMLCYVMLCYVKSKVEQVRLTDVCQGNETREFHWLLKIVARLRRELLSLNENFTALFL